MVTSFHCWRASCFAALAMTANCPCERSEAKKSLPGGEGLNIVTCNEPVLMLYDKLLGGQQLTAFNE
jgi:hypothetical protein